MFTSHDIVTSIQFSIDSNLTVCIFESTHDIEDLAASSYSVLFKTPDTKLQVIPPKDEEGDTFCVKFTPSQQIFPKGLAKILLDIPMDPILNILESADRELLETVTESKIRGRNA